MSDYDDLLGDIPEPKPAAPKKRPPGSAPNAPPRPGKRRRGRPTKAEAAAHAAAEAEKLAEKEPDEFVVEIGSTGLPDATAFHRPVTRTFLSSILGTEPRRLVKQLGKCPVVAWKQGKGDTRVPLYDFKEAIRYCVDPKIDMATWIKGQSPATLPPFINKAFWDAERSKQMVLQRAGDLWPTADVLDVLGRTAITIKDTARLWLENLPGRASLTTEQHAFLQREVASLLDEVHERLVTAARERVTPSSLAAIEQMIEDETRLPSDGESE